MHNIVLTPERIKELKDKEVARTLPRYKRIIERALNGEGSPRAAIKARCLQCVGELREEIRRCTAPHCALYEFRPYQNDTED